MVFGFLWEKRVLADDAFRDGEVKPEVMFSDFARIAVRRSVQSLGMDSRSPP